MRRSAMFAKSKNPTSVFSAVAKLPEVNKTTYPHISYSMCFINDKLPFDSGMSFIYKVCNYKLQRLLIL